MSGRGYIQLETKSSCEFCKKFAELRPYGPHGERICFECAMRDEETTAKRFAKVVLGEGLDS